MAKQLHYVELCRKNHFLSEIRNIAQKNDFFLKTKKITNHPNQLNH